MIRQHQLPVFLIGSIILGSLATAALAGIPSSPPMLLLIALPISYIPALLAVLLLSGCGDAADRAAFRRRLTTWRIGPRWYILGLTLVALAPLAGVAMATLWGGVFPLHLERFALLPLFVIINLGEEIGWRGYALPGLQQRFSPVTSSVLLGAAWAAFHWVALAQNPTHPLLYLLVASVSLVAMSVVMTWLFNRTGSIILMVLVHAMYDVITLGVVPLAQTTTPLLAFALTAATLCLVAATLRLVVGPRLGQPAQSNHQTPSRTASPPPETQFWV